LKEEIVEDNDSLVSEEVIAPVEEEVEVVQE
jgi:hypothetical protein